MKQLFCKVFEIVFVYFWISKIVEQLQFDKTKTAQPIEVMLLSSKYAALYMLAVLWYSLFTWINKHNIVTTQHGIQSRVTYIIMFLYDWLRIR